MEPPAHLSLFTLALLSQSFRGCSAQAIFAEIDKTACHLDPCWSWLSKTKRTARSRTSGQNLFVVLLTMLHLTQKLEPPTNPACFTNSNLHFLLPETLFCRVGRKLGNSFTCSAGRFENIECLMRKFRKEINIHCHEVGLSQNHTEKNANTTEISTRYCIHSGVQNVQNGCARRYAKLPMAESEIPASVRSSCHAGNLTTRADFLRLRTEEVVALRLLRKVKATRFFLREEVAQKLSPSLRKPSCLSRFSRLRRNGGTASWLVRSDVCRMLSG